MTDIIVIDNMILSLDKIYTIVHLHENDYRIYFDPEKYINTSALTFQKLHQSILKYKSKQENQKS